MSESMQETIARFWASIATVSAEDLEAVYRMGTGGPESTWFTDTQALLRQVQPHLTFVLEVGSAADLAARRAAGHLPSVEISADGLREGIPAVFSVVDAAPTAVKERFTVRAFRTRTLDHRGLEIRCGATTLSVDTVLWTAAPVRRDPSMCDLTVYAPGWIDAFGEESPVNENRLRAVFLLLDGVAGEFSVMTQLADLHVRSLAKAPADAQPLSALPAYLDRISAA